MKHFLAKFILAGLLIVTTISKAQLTRVNTTEFSENIISTFEQNNTIYTIYQKAIHANQHDIHLLSISPKGIQTNVLLLQDTINELYVLHAQFHANKFYIFYDAFALDGSKKAWFKLGIFDEIGKLLSSQTLDTTSMENLDSYVIDNTVVFSPVKGTHTTAFSINPNTYSITSQVKFLPLFSKGYTLMFDDKANKKMYYYFFKNTFQQNDEFLEIASLNLNDTSLVKWNLDVSKFNLNYDIDITHVRKTYGDTIAFSAETYTDTIVHETYILNYVVSSDKYASSILSKNCLDDLGEFEIWRTLYFNNKTFVYAHKPFTSSNDTIEHMLGYANEERICYTTLFDPNITSSVVDSIFKYNSFSTLGGYNSNENLIAITNTNVPRERIIFVIKPDDSGFRMNYLHLQKCNLIDDIQLKKQEDGSILLLLPLKFNNEMPFLYTYNLTLEDILSNTQNLSLANVHIAHYFEEHIYFNTNGTNASTHIFNLLGQSWNMGMNNNKIDVSFLPAGIYIAHIQQGNTVERLKFFKP